MAKNAVIEWSTNDSLNTDIGSTNIAEGCAPGGLNDAIRKVMSQIAAFVASATFLGNLALKPTGANGTLLLYASDSLKGTVRVGDSGIITASDAHQFMNLAGSINYLTLGTAVAQFGAAAAVSGGLATAGMIRATGSSPANLTGGPGVEVSWQTTVGVVSAYDRTTATDKSLVLQGADIALTATLGTVTTKSGHVVQGILQLGGSALGGISGQVQFNRSDGAANLGNIGWQAGNELRFANNNGGVITHVINGVESFRALTGGARLQHTQIPVQEFNRAGVGSWYIGGTGIAGDNGFAIRINAATPALYFDSGNAATFSSSIGATGAIQSASQIRSGLNGTNGSIRMNPGDPMHSGYLEFIDTSGASIGYIQKTISGDTNYVNIGAGGHYFTGGYLSLRYAGQGGVSLIPGNAAITGKLSMVDTAGNIVASIGGQTIGQPTDYSNTAGHKFNSYIQATGQVVGVTPGAGTSGGLAVRASAGPGTGIIQFTNNAGSSEIGALIADPGAGKIYFTVNAIPVMSIDTGGNLRIAGSLIQNTTP